MDELLILTLWVVVAPGYVYRRRRIEKLARKVEQVLVPEDMSIRAGGGVFAHSAGGVGILGEGAPGYAVSFKSGLSWNQRLWRLVANPISYLVRGEIRW